MRSPLCCVHITRLRAWWRGRSRRARECIAASLHLSHFGLPPRDPYGCVCRVGVAARAAAARAGVGVSGRVRWRAGCGCAVFALAIAACLRARYAALIYLRAPAAVAVRIISVWRCKCLPRAHGSSHVRAAFHLQVCMLANVCCVTCVLADTPYYPLSKLVW